MAQDLIELPDFIYKYISWENPYHKEILLENKIFFSSVKNFNDPFDSTVPLRYDLGTDDKIYNLFIKIISRDNPQLTDDEVKRIAKNEMTYDDVRGSKRIQNTINNQREIISNNFGVFSASNIYDSVLMWSHYSNFHKGLCLRFNCKNLKSFIENDCPKDDNIVVWDNVEYLDKYPELNPFQLSNEDQIMKSLLIKSSIWKYEKEFRFILFSYANKIITIPDDIIDQIILGCKISKENRQELINFAKSKNIDIIQAYRKEKDFGLGFQKIN